MNKFKKTFEKKANIAYIVAGYPSIEHTKELLKKIDESQIDILEIGIPYSDPIADGRIIEKAGLETINFGINTDTVFDILMETKTYVNKPLVFLVYYNFSLAYGIDAFIKKASQCNISGFIVPDLPYEESKSLRHKLEKANINLIQLITLTSDSRMKEILKNAKGFIYAVAVVGITGGKKANLEDLKKLYLQIRKYSKIPIAVGFGISSNEDIKELKKTYDGVIVGTKIVELCKQYPEKTIEKINELFS